MFAEALVRYEQERLGPSSEIVYSNRGGVPEGVVIDLVEALAPDGFDDVEQVLAYAEREAIVRGDAQKAGFAVPSQCASKATARATSSPDPTTRSIDMTHSVPDVIAAQASVDGIEWSILGQTYRPKQLTKRSFAWHATLPPATFVPPHVHPTQDEYVYVPAGTLTLVTGYDDHRAAPGDLVRLPMGRPHGLYNRSGETLTCLFWVTPTARLYDLFVAIDALPQQTS